jgi:hypothetical protein
MAHRLRCPSRAQCLSSVFEDLGCCQIASVLHSWPTSLSPIPCPRSISDGTHVIEPAAKVPLTRLPFYLPVADDLADSSAVTPRMVESIGSDERRLGELIHDEIDQRVAQQKVARKIGAEFQNHIDRFRGTEAPRAEDDSSDRESGAWSRGRDMAGRGCGRIQSVYSVAHPFRRIREGRGSWTIWRSVCRGIRRIYLVATL